MGGRGTPKATGSAIDAILKKGGGKKKGKKGRKIGRVARHKSSLRYKNERRWLTNRLKRMARHMKHYPDDLQCLTLMKEFKNA